MTEMDCVLGLDAGGTKTIALLVNRQGETVQRLTGPGLDPMAGEGWVAELHRLASSLRVRPVTAVLGMTLFGEVAAISARQDAVAREALGPGAQVVNDTQIAHAGAFGGKDGILVLSGTGSMVWAKGPAGHVRVGGWGHEIGDEGSAFWIGRAALVATARQTDGRDAPSRLSQLIAAETGARDLELIDWAHTAPRARIAALSRPVAELAEDGDPAAQDILNAAARALLEQALTASHRAGLPAGTPWSHAGGAMQALSANPILVQGLGRPADPPLLEPVQGAVQAARVLAGWEPPLHRT